MWGILRSSSTTSGFSLAINGSASRGINYVQELLVSVLLQECLDHHNVGFFVIDDHDATFMQLLRTIPDH